MNTKERKLQVKIVQKEIGTKSQEISDGGKRLIFRRPDLPVHHFVAYRHHGEVELGVLASDLLQGGVEPGGKELGGALLKLFGLLLELLGLLLQLVSSFLQFFSFPTSLRSSATFLH